MNKWQSWEIWAHGLAAAVIGGAAAVLTGYVAGADIHVIGKMAAGSAVVNAAAYLKRSPLPSIEAK